MPFIPGIDTSITTRSGRQSKACCTAVEPSLACPTISISGCVLSMGVFEHIGQRLLSGAVEHNFHLGWNTFAVKSDDLQLSGNSVTLHPFVHLLLHGRH